MTYYVGSNPQDVLDGITKRYFYGLRRNKDGELFLIRIDQLAGGDSNIATINEIGDPVENFPDFEEGIDFLEGIDENHNIEYDNLRYQQIKWDGRLLTYFIDPTDGQFIQRISEDYDYPQGISTPAYGEGNDNNVVK
jgi:hypothetical protein